MSPSPVSNCISESACHRALRCMEILEQVLQVFFLWDVAPMRQSFCNVALTCRAFLHPATASLWSDLPGLWPLYRILIDINEDSLITSSRWGTHLSNAPSLHQDDVPNSQSETWGKFLHYAAFVRKVHLLSLKHLQEDFAKNLFILLVEHNHGRSFLPSLREFSFKALQGLQPAHMHILSSLASPIVFTLKLRTGYSGDEESCAVIQHGLAQTITKAFPALSSLSLNLQGEAFDDPWRIVAVLAPLQHLRHLVLNWRCALHCGPSYLQVLLSTFPQLEFLDAHFSQSATTPSPGPNRVLAPRLRRLVCRGRWTAVADLPSVIQCPALEELQIALRRAHGPVSQVNCDTLATCVREIADPHFAPSLRKLDIYAPVGRQTVRKHGPPPARRTLADILHPLSALEHLEDVSFAMVFEYGVRALAPSISDDDMRAVAAALRRVRRLALLPEGTFPVVSPPTLRSLVHFATLCPRLASLSLSKVSIDSAFPSASAGGEPVRCDTLRTLRLVESPTTEPKRLAAFLHRLFPNLDVVECAFADYDATNAVVQDEMRLLQLGGRGQE